MTEEILLNALGLKLIVDKDTNIFSDIDYMPITWATRASFGVDICIVFLKISLVISICGEPGGYLGNLWREEADRLQVFPHRLHRHLV